MAGVASFGANVTSHSWLDSIQLRIAYRSSIVSLNREAGHQLVVPSLEGIQAVIFLMTTRLDFILRYFLRYFLEVGLKSAGRERKISTGLRINRRGPGPSDRTQFAADSREGQANSSRGKLRPPRSLRLTLRSDTVGFAHHGGDFYLERDSDPPMPSHQYGPPKRGLER
jgi:hypothetical protein